MSNAKRYRAQQIRRRAKYHMDAIKALESDIKSLSQGYECYVRGRSFATHIQIAEAELELLLSPYPILTADEHDQYMSELLNR